MEGGRSSGSSLLEIGPNSSQAAEDGIAASEFAKTSPVEEQTEPSSSATAQATSQPLEEAKSNTEGAREVEPSRGDEPIGASDEEDDEEEPRLKYQRLGSSVTEILSQDAASCLCVSDKLLAMGTHDGTVHVLDYAGNEVKRFEVHKSRVNDISIDEAAEFIASCSDDGSAAVHGLYTEESVRFKYNQPVKTIALDPRYGVRKTREFVTGGLAGQLLLSSKGWLGTRDTVLHSGEGAIGIARWAGSLIAWATDSSVKVYDTSIHQIIGFVLRPSAVSTPPGPARCHLFWEQDQFLYIGWGDSVKVAKIRTSRSALPKGDAKRLIEIIASFTVPNCIVAGIAPFGLDIALLVYVVDDEGSPRLAASQAYQEALRPELKFVDWQNVEKASDALSINGFEHYKADDYSLAACYLPGNSLHADPAGSNKKDFTKWWKAGDEPQYYLISPKDIVVGKPRDGDDRIDWLLQYKRFHQALQLLEADKSLRASSHQKVAQAYLEHLMNQGNFKEAAELCPSLLKDDATSWERYVYLFAQLRQLAVLAPRIPTRDPQLRGSAYEMVLHAFLLSPTDHPQLLRLLETWPSHLYSVQSLTQAVVQRIRSSGGDSEALLESAARLYQLQARYDLTLAILLRLKRERVFEFIASHHLMPLLKGQAVAQLLDIDAPRAVRLLVDFHEEVSAQVVAPAIQTAAEEAAAKKDELSAEKWRRRLHQYLDWLFIKDSVAGAAFHGLQVELYAEFEPDRLMGFLVSSQSYALEAAHELCERRGLVREQVFVLGRMGNAHEALDLIIRRLGDVPQAIDFVQMQQDDELWDLLITLALADASLTGALLDHIGSYINPLRLVRRIPEGMLIQRLRDRLVTIVADFRTQSSLRQCCTVLLQRDCSVLAQKLYREMQRALPPIRLYVKASEPSGGERWWRHDGGEAAAVAVDLADLPGPCGSKQLHLLPPDAQKPNVWVGFAKPAADLAEDPEQPLRSSARKGRARAKHKAASNSQLPTLMVS